MLRWIYNICILWLWVAVFTEIEVSVFGANYITTGFAWVLIFFIPGIKTDISSRSEGSLFSRIITKKRRDHDSDLERM